jgi:TIR domain/AAA ATPase domain
MRIECAKPIVFISYARADEPENQRSDETRWLSFVQRFLQPARVEGIFDVWTDQGMRGGELWDSEIERNLRRCDIFLLLVSPNSTASDYIVNKEIELIHERQARKEDVVLFPLLVTPTPRVGLDRISQFNMRPSGGKALSSYPSSDRDSCMVRVADDIAAIAKEITTRRDVTPVSSNALTPTAPRALSNIRLSLPLYFLGRDDDLTAIEEVLKDGKDGFRNVALHGLRGVGKSTLAAAYAERRKADYRATWWLRAHMTETMREDLVGLATRLGWITAKEKEEVALDKIRSALRENGDGILLVFDNAIDAANIRPYLLTGGSAKALVTSNSPAWRGVAKVFEVRPWPKQVGGDYLIARTGRANERSEAELLSETLGGLALAHEQAGAYCDRLGLPLAEYSKLFANSPTPLLDAIKDAPDDYHGGLTVAKAFTLAIDEASKLHPAAERLIYYASVLAPEPIPLFLFSEGRDKFGEPFASQIAERGLDEAVAALRAFALIDRETIADDREPSITTETIRLHRLVRTAAVTKQGSEAVLAARQTLLEVMTAIYPRSTLGDAAAWPRARMLDGLAFDPCLSG